MKEPALIHKINDVSDRVHKLNARAAKASRDNPTAPVVESVLFEPLPKQTLYQETLSGEHMREKHMNCQSTCAVSSSARKHGMWINDHKLSGQTVQSSCKAVLIDRNPGEQVYDKSEDAVAGKADKSGWRRSHRNQEPDKQDCNLDKLMSQFQGVATESLCSSLPLSGRSRTKEHAKRVLRRQQAEKSLADAAFQKRIAELQNSSSDSSSSSSGSNGSSSSSSASSASSSS